MKILLEELEQKLFRTREGANPLPLSRILSTERLKTIQDMERRNKEVDKFFGDKGFTYVEFKNLLRPALTKETLFGIGSEAKSRVKQFAEPIDLKTKDEESISYYDEYVETFFIYFYYQLFVKLFSDTEIIVKRNAESIKNAKTIIAKIGKADTSDVEENLLNLYRSFYTMFSSSTANLAGIANNVSVQANYFENFANNNVELFTAYPLSGFMSDGTTTNMKGLIDLLFESLSVFDPEDTGNRQISSIAKISPFVSGDKIDFDVKAFEKEGVRFSEKTAPIINDLIEELSSIEDVSRFGMGWTKGTKWEAYIKLVCGIICLEEVSDSIKKVAEKVRGSQKTSYVKLIDMGEADNGMYFVNATAFSQAIKNVDVYADAMKGLSSAITDISKKTSIVQEMDTNQLIDCLFADARKDLVAEDIKELKQADSIKKILDLTGISNDIADNLTDVLVTINKTLFFHNNPMPKLNQRNKQALEYAMTNVGDVVLKEIKPGSFSGFTNWEKIKDSTMEIIDSTEKFFTGVFNKTFGDQKSESFIDGIVSSFNSAFFNKFKFAQSERQANGSIVIKDKAGNPKYTFNNIEDFKKWVQNMCVTIPSIMYHSKVVFGGDPSNPTSGKDQRYDTYFNMISWLVKASKEKNASLASDDFPLVYLVTPFFLETVKYSLRGYINDIHKLVQISDDLRKKIEETHNLESVPDSEWKPLVEKLSKAIEELLMKKSGKSGSANQTNVA